MWLLAAAVLLAAGLRVMSGPGEVGAPRDSVELELRGMRAASALIVGGSLGAAGAMLQALTHNPLASPALLGTTSGAGLAVMIWILVVTQATGSPPRAGPPVFVPLIGALGALGAVLGLAGRGGFSDLLRLILTGVVVGMIAAAGSMLAQHLLPDRGLALGARWFLGDLSDDVTLRLLLPAAGAMAVGVIAGVWLGPAVDAVTLEEGEALTMGAAVTWVRGGLFFLSGLLTAAAVSLAGPIGFIGLIGPHLARAIVGPEHRRLILGSALAGALLLLLADAGVRLVDLRAGRVPVGVVTAVVGGPALLWLMRRRAW